MLHLSCAVVRCSSIWHLTCDAIASRLLLYNRYNKCLHAELAPTMRKASRCCIAAAISLCAYHSSQWRLLGRHRSSIDPALPFLSTSVAQPQGGMRLAAGIGQDIIIMLIKFAGGEFDTAAIATIGLLKSVEAIRTSSMAYRGKWPHVSLKVCAARQSASPGRHFLPTDIYRRHVNE